MLDFLFFFCVVIELGVSLWESGSEWLSRVRGDYWSVGVSILFCLFVFVKECGLWGSCHVNIMSIISKRRGKRWTENRATLFSNVCEKIEREVQIAPFFSLFLFYCLIGQKLTSSSSSSLFTHVPSPFYLPSSCCFPHIVHPCRT